MVESVAERWPDTVVLSGAALPQGSERGPDALGHAYEALADEALRRLGLHYTPATVAERLVAIGLDGLDGLDAHHPAASTGRDLAPVVCDPACGGGAFLLAAARHLDRAGVDRRVVVERHLVGIDVDPVASAVAATALVLWSGDAATMARVSTCDALTRLPWPERPALGFDLVIGNPPFQSQLASRTARGAEGSARLRAHLGDGASGYADTSALFLLAAVGQVRPRGRVVLIQPQSVLAGRDTAAVRRVVDERAPLEGLWVCDEPVFAAGTRVCAPVLRVVDEEAMRATTTTVRRWWGPSVRRAEAGEAPSPGIWASLAAGLRDTPVVHLSAPPDDGLAGATAGFRDQFYGLVDHVREATGAPDERPLVTSGLIDPAECAWGWRDLRFARQRWRAPVVDVAGLGVANPALGAWVADRLVPKVLVATQTRVLEAVADVEGIWVPSTPVIAVPAPPGRLWHVLAALLAPPVTAWALQRSAGTALAPDALKLSAAQVRAVPAPVDAKAWDDGAAAAQAAQEAASDAARRDALEVMGRAMVAAHGLAGADGDALSAWWLRRLERRRAQATRSLIRGAGQ